MNLLAANSSRPSASWLPGFLRPTAPIGERIEDPVRVNRLYRYYRPRILAWSMAGYAMFYFVRKNISIAMPVMGQQLGVSKADLGLFLTLHGLLYGISKFANGFVGDRANARTFMAFGLICSAVLNICFGLSTAVIALGIFWMINGWFQGMGFPPCARLLTHWFSPKELAIKMSIWNTSHSIGACAIVVLGGYLVDPDRWHDPFLHANSWRLGFFVPAALAAACGGLLLIYLRDTPESVGLPEVAGTEGPAHQNPERERRALLNTGYDALEREQFRALLIEKVFHNRYIWILSVANFFVYTIRYAVLDWGPTMLKESRGITLAHAGWMVAAFELAGVVGFLTTGWITDRLFTGRGARTCVFCMTCCGIALALFWRIPAGHTLLSTALLMASGFFIYGPQGLIGISTANLATKRAAATAIGLTSIFGYASTVLSGWGLGLLVQRHGWNAAFILLLITAAAATLCFILAWPAPRDGYDDPRKPAFPVIEDQSTSGDRNS